MAKAPIPGYCKTRLIPYLEADVCADLQEALLLDLINLKKELEPEIDVWIAYTPEASEGYFKTLCNQCFPQIGENLGERMKNGIRKLIAKDYASVLVIGTDTPLNKMDIKYAVKRVKKHSVVIGPALDGGYYLIGVTHHIPSLFEHIKWSTDSVFKETVNRIKCNNLIVDVLPKKRDIDDWEDLLFYQEKKTNPHLDRWKTNHLSR
ncbi:TIGR04282 family arsenosugar biosynthesis glycosyltransferase [Radiobacillus deserti]|uniref:Glycosyltransferase n=1 Tax=Radiobacillus deserti TaxID=2594883 RepID=A0A516KIW8_9BACI|nr:TIGR04282 family arsenosugar biosynthesis glycosyltransferase [Radiobacillus deserti]QDP41347.1 glycosyltransferase [Radiobacillus deserti]